MMRCLIDAIIGMGANLKLHLLYALGSYACRINAIFIDVLLFSSRLFCLRVICTIGPQTVCGGLCILLSLAVQNRC